MMYEQWWNGKNEVFVMMNGLLRNSRLLLSEPPTIGIIGGADGPRVMLVSGNYGEFILAGILAVLVLALIVIFIVRGRRKKKYRRIRKPNGSDPKDGGGPSEG